MRIMSAVTLLVTTACGSTTPDTAPPSSAPASDTTSTVQAAPEAPAGPVELRTDRTRYRPGATVGLTIVNRSDSTYAFNPCTRTIERETGGTWSAVDEGGRMCTMEAWILEPNATRTAETELPSSLRAGRYRLVIALTVEGQAPGGAAVRAVSRVVEVE